MKYSFSHTIDSMKIIVCIKQVPASSNVQIDPVTGVLIRDGNNTKMNPYDLYALETALRIKAKTSAVITTITMGPPSAKIALEESLWMGIDRGYLLTDRQFAGADVVATSYTLSQGIDQIGDYDLIICGKQTTDGDTAQVGPEIAEHLHIPHVAYVEDIIEVKDKSIVVRVSMDLTSETIEIQYPCLITVEKGIYTPRLPSYKTRLLQKPEQIKIITLNDFSDKDVTHYGLKGSPTQVEAMFTPSKEVDKVTYTGDEASLADSFYQSLKALKVL